MKFAVSEPNQVHNELQLQFVPMSLAVHSPRVSFTLRNPNAHYTRKTPTEGGVDARAVPPNKMSPNNARQQQCTRVLQGSSQHHPGSKMASSARLRHGRKQATTRVVPFGNGSAACHELWRLRQLAPAAAQRLRVQSPDSCVRLWLLDGQLHRAAAGVFT